MSGATTSTPIPTQTSAPVERAAWPAAQQQSNQQQQLEYIHRAAWKAGVLGALNMMAKVLAARFIVLVAIVGGIMLALPALSQPDLFKILMLGVYCVGVVLPAVVLAALERR